MNSHHKAFPFRPYKVFHPLKDIERGETHGQSWDGLTIEENIALCPLQTLEPILLEFLPTDGRILEAGCGTGRWVFYLRRLNYDIVGIDLASRAIELARDYDSSAPIYHGDVCQLEFENGSFDAVMSLGVIEHFEEGPHRSLAEFRRVLSDRGVLIITVPSQNIVRRLLTNNLKTAMRMFRKWNGVRYGFEEYRFTRKQVRTILTQAGFDVVNMAPDDFRLPLNMGLYVDLPVLRSPARRWELNRIGKLVQSVLNALSPWAACSGTTFVCRKKQSPERP